jgi:hypothetical protein
LTTLGPTAVSGSVAARKWGLRFWELADRDRRSETPPGAMVVLSTTNGTRIIEAAQGAFAILAGAFVNAHTVADEPAVGAYGERVAVIGCGWEGGWASEDESAAGAILCRLRQRGVGLDERVRRVVELYLRAPRRRCAGTAPLDVSCVSGTGGNRFLPRREHRAGRPSSRRRDLREPAVEGCWP